MSKESQKEDISDAVSAISSFAHSHHQDLSLEDATRLLRQALLSPTTTTEPLKKTRLSNLRWFPGKESTRVEATIAWLEKTGEFSTKELNRIRGIPVLVESDNQEIRLNQRLLGRELATFILGLINLIAGISIGWLLFSEGSGMQQVLQGAGIGMALGAMTNLVLNRSFRFYQSSSRIQQVAPWLVSN